MKVGVQSVKDPLIGALGRRGSWGRGEVNNHSGELYTEEGFNPSRDTAQTELA